jgi:hypothetical protein
MNDYWVGSIGKALFVFDPDIQPSTVADVTLFSYSHDRPVKLDKSTVKSRIRRAAKDTTVDILKRYANWKQFYRSELQAINASPAFDTPKFIASAQSGAIRGNWGRKANCYNCGSELLGKRGNVCEQCFWIKCSCGACGCGWSPRNNGE